MPDFYWRMDSFQALPSLVEELRREPRLELLARYCELREKGLRKEAFRVLESFLGSARSWNVPGSREVALIVLDMHWRTPEVSELLPDPLRRRFLEPVLEAWMNAEPGDPLPVRHLGLLLKDFDLLERAFQMNPGDDDVRAALVRDYLGRVDFATHHLSESVFLSEEENELINLQAAEALLAKGPGSEPFSALRNRARRLRRLLEDWNEYRVAPEGTFPEWCQQRGKDHGWWAAYYYER